MAGKLDKIVVVDIESTCWEDRDADNEESEVIEIGVCVVDAATRARLPARAHLVRPERSRVSPFCTRLTTLTQEQVEAGISFADACRLLETAYDTRVRTWASYGDYDRRQFERQCARSGVRLPFGPTHINVKNLFALAHRLEHEVAMGKALDRAGRLFEGTQHRAADDAWNAAGLLVDVLWPGEASP